jgi:hypothetical protein
VGARLSTHPATTGMIASGARGRLGVRERWRRLLAALRARGASCKIARTRVAWTRTCVSCRITIDRTLDECANSQNTSVPRHSTVGLLNYMASSGAAPALFIGPRQPYSTQ